MRLPTVIAIAATLAMSLPGLAPAADAPQGSVPARVVATQSAMRDLWLGHIFWVRNVVESRLANNAAPAKAIPTTPLTKPTCSAVSMSLRTLPHRSARVSPRRRWPPR